MGELSILEGNCYLHAGESKYNKDFNYLGFPTGGIYQLMQKVCNLFTSCKDFAIVFDSPSFRKRIDSDYKLSRKVSNKILAQSKVIIPNLKRAGINVLQVPDFEGDDLVYNIVKANNDRNVVIYTCDYDLAINVSRHCRIMGCRKGFPAINYANFEFVVSNDGRQIPYNSIGMEKVIFGCNSDNIHGIGEDAELAWSLFLAVRKKNFIDKGKALIVNEDMCMWLINNVFTKFSLGGKKVSQESIETMRRNVKLVFPRVLTKEEIERNDIELNKFYDADYSAILDICRLFNMRSLYRMISRYYSLTNNERIEAWLSSRDTSYTDQLEEKEKNYVLAIASKYKQNGYAIEAGVPIDSSVSYHGSKDDSTYDGNIVNLDSDYDEVSNGSNIGEF